MVNELPTPQAKGTPQFQQREEARERLSGESSLAAYAKKWNNAKGRGGDLEVYIKSEAGYEYMISRRNRHEPRVSSSGNSWIEVGTVIKIDRSPDKRNKLFLNYEIVDGEVVSARYTIPDTSQEILLKDGQTYLIREHPLISGEDAEDVLAGKSFADQHLLSEEEVADLLKDAPLPVKNS